MTPWSAEERYLWDEMMTYRPNIETNRRYKQQLALARRKWGKQGERLIKQRYGLLTEQEAARRSWILYQRWVEH